MDNSLNFICILCKSFYISSINDMLIINIILSIIAFVVFHNAFNKPTQRELK